MINNGTMFFSVYPKGQTLGGPVKIGLWNIKLPTSFDARPERTSYHARKHRLAKQTADSDPGTTPCRFAILPSKLVCNECMSKQPKCQSFFIHPIESSFYHFMTNDGVSDGALETNNKIAVARIQALCRYRDIQAPLSASPSGKFQTASKTYCLYDRGIGSYLLLGGGRSQY